MKYVRINDNSILFCMKNRFIFENLPDNGLLSTILNYFICTPK